MTDTSRAQLVADAVISSLRSECADSYITGEGDVWIDEGGSVLIFRKKSDYCEKIFSYAEIDPSIYLNIKTDATLQDGSGITDRAIFRLFSEDVDSVVIPTTDTNAGYVHFGYYKSTGGTSTPVSLSECFDYTNPFPYATYREFTVDLTFEEIGLDSDGCPTWVICRVDVKKGSEVIYTRETVLCFAAPKTVKSA